MNEELKKGKEISYLLKKIFLGVEVILFVGILAFAFLCLLMLVI